MDKFSPENEIKEFCIKLYNKEPTKFGRYTDWETYWILQMIQIPYSTVVNYTEFWDKYDDSSLMVNSNWMLQFGRIKRGRFVRIF